MSEYIKREQVLKLLESAQAWGWSMNTLYDEIQALPAEDVAPVVHGRWTTPRAIRECKQQSNPIQEIQVSPERRYNP